MKCRKVCELSSEYLAGDLDPRNQSEIRAHLSQCESCRAEFTSMERAIHALSAPRAVFETPDVLADVKRLAAIEQVRSRRLQPVFAACTAAVVAAAIAALWFALEWNPTTPILTPPSVVAVPPDQPAPPPEAANSAGEDATTGDKIVTAPASVADLPKTFAALERSGRVHSPRPRPTPSVPEQPGSAELEPTVEYIMVYTPDVPQPAQLWTPSAVSMDAALPRHDISVGTAVASEYTAAVPDNSSYSIRMVDHASGEVTTLNVYTETVPGEEPGGVIEFSVKPAEPPANSNDDERSSTDGTLPPDIAVSHPLLI